MTLQRDAPEEGKQAYKSPWMPRCQGCDKPATYQVFDGYGRKQGTFCEKCADEQIGWLDRYEAGRRRLP